MWPEAGKKKSKCMFQYSCRFHCGENVFCSLERRLSVKSGRRFLSTIAGFAERLEELKVGAVPALEGCESAPQVVSEQSVM